MQNSPTYRVIAAFGWMTLGTSGVIGVLLNLPFLISEWARLPPLELALTYVGEIVAILAFLMIGLRLFCARRSSGKEIVDQDKVQNIWQDGAILFAIFGSLFFDIGMTAYIGHREPVRRSHAESGTLRILSIQEFGERNSGHFGCLAQGVVVDSKGTKHPTHIYFTSRGRKMSFELERATRVVPTEIPVRYDPQHPRRIWMQPRHAVGPPPIVIEGILVTTWQLLVSVLFVIVRGMETLPFALPIELAPFIALSGCLLYGGVRMLLHGETSFDAML